MLVRMRQYIIAFTVTLGAAVIYQNLVTPWMQPPRVARMQAASLPPLERFTDGIKELFPDENCWQRSGCKVLKTAGGMLLFEDCVDLKNNKVKLTPVTIVVGHGLKDGGKSAPIIVEAAQGAEIQFTGSLEVLSGSTPAIERGRVIGPVLVQQKGADQAEPELLVKTSNVGIDSKKIWTTDEFDLRAEGLSMKGRDLTLHLNGSGNGTPELDRIELIYLYGLKYLINDQNSADFACTGRVEYRFGDRTLEMRDSVSLVYHEGQVASTFDCSFLQCVLADQKGARSDRGSLAKHFETITAVGQPVRLNSGSLGVDFSAQQIEVKSGTGRRISIRASDQRGVQVKSAAWSGVFENLSCTMELGQEPRLLELLVEGFGRASYRDDSDTVGDMSWGGGFKLSEGSTDTPVNTPVNGAAGNALSGLPNHQQPPRRFDYTLDGQVKGRFKLGIASRGSRQTSGQFESGSLQGAVKLISREVQSSPQSAKPGKTKTSCLPEWAIFQDDVRITTDSVDALTDELLLFFEQKQFLSNARRQDSRPSGAEPTAVTHGVVEPVAKKSNQRQTIRGDRISAKLGISLDDRWTPEKVTVEGNVAVEYTHVQRGKVLPAKLTGHDLQYEAKTGNDVVQLRGDELEPARLDLGDGFFVGPMIQLRPSQNVLWINAAGEFQLPTSLLETAPEQQNTNTLHWVNAPHCRWLGEFLFDGKAVVLTDSVDITASLLMQGQALDVHLTGDRMQVDLDGNVKMMEPGQMQAAKVRRVTITESQQKPVEIQVLRLEAGEKRQSKHLLYTRKLEFTPAELGGLVKGYGPGWYRGWLPQGEDRDAGNQNAGTSLGGTTDLYTGIHLLFSDSMQVNLATKTLDFLGGVRVGKRGVGGFDAPVFDAATMDSISVGDATLDCERIRVNVDPASVSSVSLSQRPNSWEMEAVGGVVFRDMGVESGLLVGTASRVTYSKSKDLFTIDGSPNRPAFFELTNHDNTPRAKGTVRTMTIRVSTKEIDKLILESLDIAAPQGRAIR